MDVAAIATVATKGKRKQKSLGGATTKVGSAIGVDLGSGIFSIKAVEDITLEYGHFSNSSPRIFVRRPLHYWCI